VKELGIGVAQALNCEVQKVDNVKATPKSSVISLHPTQARPAELVKASLSCFVIEA
jgi:hypothetical protein